MLGRPVLTKSAQALIAHSRCDPSLRLSEYQLKEYIVKGCVCSMCPFAYDKYDIILTWKVVKTLLSCNVNLKICEYAL